MVILLIVIYIFIGVIIATMVSKFDEDENGDLEINHVVWIGIFWPLAIIAFIGAWIGNIIYNTIKKK